MKILIIEDNPANLELMRYLLQAHGYSILTARDGRSGMEAISREHPDLVLCDVGLPVVDGYELARRVKGDRVLSRIPLVAVTAFAMDQDRSRISSAGFDGCITKPITPETFAGEILGLARQAVARNG
jgi:two-component system cell cycle response regulator